MTKENIELKVELRDLKKEKTREGLKRKKIPAIVYGNGIENEALWVDSLSFNKIYNDVGENAIIKLNIEDKSDDNVLVYDIQWNPLTDEIIHIDFLRVDMSKEVEAEVPLEFVGESPAIKEMGGVLVKSLNSVNIKSLPGNIPSELKVDLSALKTFEDHYKVRDLVVDDSVDILTGEEVVIASVAPPRSEEDLAKLDEKIEEDVSQVEGAEKESDEVDKNEKEDKENDEKVEK